MDEVRLHAFLRERLPGFAGPMMVTRYDGGASNPTYLLETSETRCVLRRKPRGALTPTAHAVDREYRVLTVLADTDVPAPRPVLLCEDEAVIGHMFYVMEHVPGRLLTGLSDAETAPPARTVAYADFAATLARIHRVDVMAGLGSFGLGGDYVRRQLDRLWGQYRALKIESEDGLVRVAAWLGDHLPDSSPVGLIHGDYRPRNVIVAPDRPVIAAVLDWELSTLGHPLADLAYCCLPHLLRDVDPEAGETLLAPGVPDEETFIALYRAARGGSPLDDYPFFRIFALFRSAVLRAGIAARARAGDTQAAAFAGRAESYRAVARIAAALVASPSPPGGA